MFSIKVPVILSQATALIFYQTSFALSRTFLFFFFLSLPLTSQLNYSTTCIAICQPFFYKFFQLFSQSGCRHYMWCFYMILSYYLPLFHCADFPIAFSSYLRFKKTTGKIPVVFMDNIERRKRDLNPRADFPTYTP